MLIALATVFGCLAPANAQSTQFDVTRKLSLAAAKGELSSQQVIVFKEQISNALKSNSRAIQNERLTAIGDRIERQRKPRRVASRLFGWF
jgi:hypothetical protein